MVNRSSEETWQHSISSGLPSECEVLVMRTKSVSPCFDRLRHVLLALVLLTVSFTACDDKPLRGDSQRSSDGKTYLAIMNRNNCSQVRVDGKEWPWDEGIHRPISPGIHRISCAGKSPIEFTVRAGETFNFDYWGP